MSHQRRGYTSSDDEDALEDEIVRQFIADRSHGRNPGETTEELAELEQKAVQHARGDRVVPPTRAPNNNAAKEDQLVMSVVARRSQASGAATTDYHYYEGDDDKDPERQHMEYSNNAATPAPAAASSSNSTGNRTEYTYDNRGRAIFSKTAAPISINADTELPGAYHGLPVRAELRHLTPALHDNIYYNSNSNNNNPDPAEAATPETALTTNAAEEEETRPSNDNSNNNNNTTNEEGIAVVTGTLITGSDGGEENKKNTRMVAVGSLVFFLIIVLILAIALPISLSSKNEDSPAVAGEAPKSTAEEASGTAALGSDSYSPDVDFSLLPPNTNNQTLQALREDPLSPRLRAYKWIAGDDNWETYPDWRKAQRFGLACLVYTTLMPRLYGGKFEIWLNYKVHECDWAPLPVLQAECNDMQQLREMIVYTDDSDIYKVRMAPELFLLPGLESLHMWWVNLAEETSLVDMLALQANHPLPQSSVLRELNITRCRISATLPTELGLLTSLTLLDFSFNNLQSTIPSELGLLTNLETLRLQGNDLSSTVPEEVRLLPSLKLLNVQDNEKLQQ